MSDWKWYVWRGAEWIGFIKDERTALAWIRDQAAKGRTGFVVNNVAPPKPEQANKAADFEGYVPPKRTRKTAPAPRVKVATKAAETKEMRELKRDAAKIVAKHKRDEAAELEAGAGR